MNAIRSAAGSIVIALIAHAALADSNRIYVNAAASGANNGTSWADAYTQLQSALQNAPADSEIWVARGTYVPTGPKVCLYAPPPFQLRSQVAIYGGFAGTETQLLARDPAANQTILSGDIAHNDPASITDNSYNVVYDSGSDDTAVLDGFTIAHGVGGQAEGSPFCLGGAGLRLENSHAMIRNCVISNAARPTLGSQPGTPGVDGGGAYITGGGPTFDHCSFTGNSAANGVGPNCAAGHPTAGYGSAGSGGAVYISSASPQFLACSFINNSAGNGTPGSGCLFSGTAGGPGGSGGAVYAANSTSRFFGCTFDGNSAGAGGNGASGSWGALLDGAPGMGGAIYAIGGTMTLTRCLFNANRTFEGGSGGCTSIGGPVAALGGGHGGGAALINCDVVIDGCRFIANHTGDGGQGAGCSSSMGGITPSRDGGSGAAVYVQGGSALVVSSIFDSNRTGAGGPGVAGSLPVPAGLPGVDSVTGTIVNCTFVANRDANGANLDAGRFASTNSIVWMPGDPATPIDPRFINPTGADGILGTPDDDFGLLVASPYIDAGNNALVPAGFTLDAAGNPRFVDVASVPDTGVGTAPIVDMGALETSICAADFNRSGTVSVQDIFDYLNAWLSGDPRADLNGGGLSQQDIFDFINVWFDGCP